MLQTPPHMCSTSASGPRRIRGVTNPRDSMSEAGCILFCTNIINVYNSNRKCLDEGEEYSVHGPKAIENDKKTRNIWQPLMASQQLHTHR